MPSFTLAQKRIKEAKWLTLVPTILLNTLARLTHAPMYIHVRIYRMSPNYFYIYKSQNVTNQHFIFLHAKHSNLQYNSHQFSSTSHFLRKRRQYMIGGGFSSNWIIQKLMEDTNLNNWFQSLIRIILFFFENELFIHDFSGNERHFSQS